jgi:glycosyltransferase involved in cell wall biosynthesis
VNRILFVVNEPGFFVSHRLPIAKAALSRGYDVHVATPHGANVATIEAAGFAWHPIRLARASTRPGTELATLRDLHALYGRLRPQLVHHVTPKPVLYGTLAARLARVPAVVNAISGMGHVFADPGRATRLLRTGVMAGYRLALRHPRMRVIFQNDDQLDQFVARGWVRPEEAVIIRGSGVDTALFHPAGTPRTDLPIVLLAARMLRTKGVVEFVEAARQLRHAGVRARFVLVGEPDPGNPASIPLEQLEDWHRQEVVEYWGRREDMPTVLRGADVFCLPSYLEGLSKSLIEAAAAGLPIVTTDVPGCRDVAADGVNGLLVSPADAAALSAALGRLITNAELRSRLGARGRERALREFALDRVVDEHLAVYRALLGDRGLVDAQEDRATVDARRGRAR